VFKLVVPVLLSLLVIRVTVRVLHNTFPHSNLMRVVERSVSWLAWIVVVLWITGVMPILLQELDAISWKIGGEQVSVRNLIEGLLTAVVVLMGALWVSAALEARLIKGATDNLSVRKMAANALRALLLFVGLMLALAAAGIDLTALGVLGGALGVGIGFGLQKLAANYISGFVILAERSMRIGDMVKVDTFEGRITDITTRYTVIRSNTGREAIVPNEMMITQRVENNSLADPQVLLTTVVQVAYGTDLPTLMPQLAAAAATVPRVLAQPGPAVMLSNFAPDGLELTVAFWIADAENGQLNVRSGVNLAVLAALNAAGVQIPFPQRTLHLPGLQAASGQGAGLPRFTPGFPLQQAPQAGQQGQ
jgi:small-conductance mechanosensitive channel